MKPTQKETKKPPRIAIYPHDITKFFGVCSRQGRRLYQEMKKNLKKEPHHVVTYEDFCYYFNVSEKVLFDFMSVTIVPGLFALLYLWIFRDDSDLAVLYSMVLYLAWDQWRYWRKGVKQPRDFSRIGLFPFIAALVLSASALGTYSNLPADAPWWKTWGNLTGAIIFGGMFVAGVVAVVVGRQRRKLRVEG